MQCKQEVTTLKNMIIQRDKEIESLIKERDQLLKE